MGAQVLLVDDDVELVELLRDYLSRDGFQVEVAHDGETGASAALSGRHDIAVLDVMMPGISGIQALARIRAASPLPVLMLSARGDDMDRIVGLELGADDYVSKPCTPRELAARLRAILKRVGATGSSIAATPVMAGSIVSLLFAAWLAWYSSRPIRSLRQAFEAAAGGQLETRIGDSMGNRQDELSDLGASFDQMAERLQGLVDGQRQLLHDVSHELRSPLARLQAAADLLSQQPERSAEFAERIKRDTGRMDKLVGELLTLARLNANMTGNLAESVDLYEIIAAIAEDADFEAEAKNCRVELVLDQALQVRGNRELIHRAVENVVRNALRHSPPGGLLSIIAHLDTNSAYVQIDIMDEGPGVPAVDLNAIFKPFFRSSSNNSDAFAGYGLGLAITQRVVEAHGGKIIASNRHTGGLCMTLLLPVEAMNKHAA